MGKCFVIQPFDRDTYDKRFSDTFKPALEAAGLTPYRVDEDHSSRVLIDDIERNIKDSKICFAEITTNNPNVWYELGYAFACGKDVIMVSCPDERNADFPFDVRHKAIITYKSKSPSDFTELAKRITEKARALLSTEKAIEDFNSSPVAPTEGLTQSEIAVLIIILENQPTELDTLSIYRLSDYMSKAGFKDAATNMATRTLKRKNMIRIAQEPEFDGGDPLTVCLLTDAGEEWLMNNQDRIRMRVDDADEFPF